MKRRSTASYVDARASASPKSPRHAKRRLVASLLALALVGAARAEEFAVEVTDSSFTPSTLDVRPGDTVVWTNAGGVHNVVADDGSFRSGDPTGARFTFRQTFANAGEFPYYCGVHGGAGGIGMAGLVRVRASAFAIDANVRGAWFDPAASAQGVFVDVSPPTRRIGVAWFTWADGGGYDWVTGDGSYRDDRATLTLRRSRGGVRNGAATIDTRDAGTVEIAFTDCGHATLDFALTDPIARGRMMLRRALPDDACPGD